MGETVKTAIVTGASAGIGLALARMLAQEGYALTINARRDGPLEAMAQELRERGGAVETVAGSIGEESVIVEIVRRHRERFEGLDVLCNNAGVAVGQAAGELSTKRLDLMLGVNLRSLPLFYREALPLLEAAALARGSAAVINTASISGKQGEAWLAAYSATKHGVVGFTQAMNAELGPKGIRSTALCPGIVHTPASGYWAERMAPEQMIQPSDIAAMVRTVLQLSPACCIPEIVFEQHAAPSVHDLVLHSVRKEVSACPPPQP